MADLIKNITPEEKHWLRDAVKYQDGQIVSKTLAQNDAFSMTLFAVASGEAISAHTSKGDALVLIIEGKADITIDNKDFHLGEGECIVMPANVPHALAAPENFKFLLIQVFK